MSRAPHVRRALGHLVLVGVRRLVTVVADRVGQRVDEGPALDLGLDAGSLGKYGVGHRGSSGTVAVACVTE